jgi:7-carboxy-7-deazaguanine synthase
LTQRIFSPETTSGLEGLPVPTGHAFLTEMFSGIQGEGPHVGVRQIFVRFDGCDLRCWWCDTPGSLVRRGAGSFETAPGTREFEPRANPIPLDDATRLLARLRPDRHHSVSFTGGEPLLQPEGVRHLAEAIHGMNGVTYLETHGARIRELERVIDVIDVVSMDVKLPSSTGEQIDLRVHHEFLQVAARGAEAFAKIVVTPETLASEVLAAAKMVTQVSRGVPLILQPVTPFGRIKKSPSPEHMLDLQARCLEVHPVTRVIPQTHKLTGQM